MRVGNARTALEGFGRGYVIMPLHVMNKAEQKIEIPIIGQLFDTPLHQFDRQVWPAGTLWRFLRKKNGTETISRLQLGIETYGDIQKRIQHVVLLRPGHVTVPEVLN